MNTFKFGDPKNQQIQPPPYMYEPVYTDAFFTDEQCAEVIRIGESLKKEPAKVGNTTGNLNEEIRRSNVSWIGPEHAPKEFFAYIESLVQDNNEKFFKFDIIGMESLQYSVYDSAYMGHYSWHTDTSKNNGDMRKISISILLSDPSEYEGGRFLFNQFGTVTDAYEKKGRAILFPSWIPHCVTPVKRGVRKSLVGWVVGPNLK